ncbi:putative methyltransferase-domain-containing protein [Scheffersomyces xylosifermentans]|uniref:putative methyltransferase-domain-containing protein n=1 Tax=Scheffersomyces xylosifermentans TaxID=1304137 RepID=UPI00315DB6BA
MGGRTLTLEKIKSYLELRIPVYEFLNDHQDIDFTPVVSETAAQESVLTHLKESKIIERNAYYARLFLKSYISLIEKLGFELSEELYEIYCEPVILNAQELCPTDTDVIKYPIGGFDEKQPTEISKLGSLPFDSVLIKETPKVISGINTTGLRTWEAALYLSNYLNNKKSPPYDFKGKTLLELGGGTGLLSLSLLSYYHHHISPIERLVLTDGAVSVFDHFNATLKLNGISNSESQSPGIRCQQLLWGTTNSSNPESFIQDPVPNVDVVLAADVTYDSTILEPLCSTIHDFFTYSGTKVAIIAATVRNEDTIRDWENELEKWFRAPSLAWKVKDRCLKPEDIDSLVWFRRGTPEIRIYEITSSIKT